MYAFDFERPTSTDDAAAKFSSRDDAMYLAGGMTLIPTLKQRLASPDCLVDLSAIPDLKGISRDGDGLSVGAATTHAEVAASADVRSAIPALADLAGHIGDPQVRNRGTLGGSIANADPAADYPAAVVALKAIVVTDKREIAGDDFFVELFETALEPGEIVKSVRFQAPKKGAYIKFPNPASRYAVVGVFVAQFDDGVRLAVTGAGPCVFRVEEMETALNSDFSPSAIEGVSASADGLNNDLHASAEYRAHLIGVMARRAVEKAAAS